MTSTHVPDPYRIAFIEPPASRTRQLQQLLEFEGIDVVSIGPDDVPRLPDLQVDLIVINHARLRAGTLAVAASVGRWFQTRPLSLALVGHGDELSGIELVERGLDAFIVSSCGAREFVARVRALLRRARRPVDADRPGSPTEAIARTVQRSDLHIDPSRRHARLRGQDLRLTEQEFQLLYFLAGSPGRVFDRQALLDAVWGNDTFVTTRSVDALVKRLRQQLRTASHGESCVETVRGVGYRLSDTRLNEPMSAA